jgi:translation initiation factor 2B subunit (eIF-2B alpha/beta/delta family)
VSSVAATVEELRSNRTNGGSWMARRAIEALQEVAAQPVASTEELVERLTSAGRELALARPAMGAIMHAVGRLVASAHVASHLGPTDLQQLVSEEASGLIASRERAAASIAVHLAPRLNDALVLTHSNSATVREAVVHTPPARVYCTISGPVEEGLRLADDLRAAGIEVEIVDGEELTRALGSTSFVLVGADTVYEDGSVKNKIGTRPLAERAREAGVRTIVACELLKLAPIPAPETEDEPELRDTTPADLIDEIVTEEGSVPPDGVRSVIERTPFLRDGYGLLRG